MRRYRDQSGSSGVFAFQPGSDYIDVEFVDHKVYRYTHEIPGRHEVEAMKSLAEEGRGLATYINQHVRERYALRLR